jgi:hypothetical protein
MRSSSIRSILSLSWAWLGWTQDYGIDRKDCSHI